MTHIIIPLCPYINNNKLLSPDELSLYFRFSPSQWQLIFLHHAYIVLYYNICVCVYDYFINLDSARLYSRP